MHEHDRDEDRRHENSRHEDTRRPDRSEPNIAPGAAASAHGGGAGGGLDLNNGSTARERTGEVSADTRHSAADPELPRAAAAPVAAPHASLTVPSSGDRGTGGGLGDAAGGARRATASELTGSHAHVGDVSVEIPGSGSATDGAAAGGGMSRGAAAPEPPGAADPGAGSDLTGAMGRGPEAQPRGEPARSGLGKTPAGGRLEDFDASFERREDEGEERR